MENCRLFTKVTITRLFGDKSAANLRHAKVCVCVCVWLTNKSKNFAKVFGHATKSDQNWLFAWAKSSRIGISQGKTKRYYRICLTLEHDDKSW